MRQFYLTICGMLLLAIPAMGATTYRSMELNRADGTSLVVAIENDMAVKVAGGELNLSCSKGDIYIPVSELKNWRFTQSQGDPNVWAAIDEVISDAADRPVLIREAGSIRILNLQQGAPVRMITIDGRIISSGHAVAGSDFVIDIDALPSGIYVITYDNHSIKLAIR